MNNTITIKLEEYNKLVRDSGIVAFIGMYWESQETEPQALLQGAKVRNVTGSFRDAINAAFKHGLVTDEKPTTAEVVERMTI